MKPTLFAFTGQIGAGKTYCSLKKMQELKSDGFSVMSIAWADKLKQVIYASTGMLKSGEVKADADKVQQLLKREILALVEEQEDVFLEKDALAWEEKFDTLWSVYGKEIRNIVLDVEQFDQIPSEYSTLFRRLIQLVGTEIGRGMRDHIWIDACMTQVETAMFTGTVQGVFIDDTRFLNEYESIMDFQEAYSGFDVEIYGVEASVETRSKRLGITPEEVHKFSEHASERHVPDIIKNIPVYNRIWNDKELTN